MIRVNPIHFGGYFPGRRKVEQEDPILSIALQELKNIEFSNDDVKHVKKIGAEPPFKNGRQAYEFIKRKDIKVKFANFQTEDVHARWDIDNKTILINEIYKNTKSRAVILAIAESILHETGHAKDLDGSSSIQEELDCLALNSMAHRNLNKKDPGIFETNDANILKNGVNLYAEIYFSNDLSELINKIRKSYGQLPSGDIKHPSSDFANAVKNSQSGFTLIA